MLYEINTGVKALSTVKDPLHFSALFSKRKSSFYMKVIDLNEPLEGQMLSVFEKVSEVDYLNKKKIEENMERIVKYDDLAEYIPRESERFTFKRSSETEISKYLIQTHKINEESESEENTDEILKSIVEEPDISPIKSITLQRDLTLEK